MFLRFFPGPLRLLLLPVLWLTCAAEGNAVKYEVVPCCSPCQAIHDRANYNTDFLSIFTILVQGQNDWLFRSDIELMTRFGPDDANLQRIKRLSDLLKERGTELALVYHPTRGLVHASKVPNSAKYDYSAASASYRQALERLRTAGVIVPDLTPLLNETGQEHEYFFRRDHHWTTYGAQRAARIVAEQLRKQPVYGSLEKQDFINQRVGLLRRNGTLQIAWQRLCGETFADQYVDAFLAEPVGQVAGGNQQETLFGSKLPPVVLAGTSFSSLEVNYGFEGYLKEYLGVDILNESLEGSGGYDSLIQYFMSEEFHTQPPKLLVWEIPSYHDLNKDLYYRQMHALIQNGCVGKPVELAKTTRLKSGRNEILFNGGGELKTLRSGNYLLEMQFDNPQAKHINATVWYVNGRNERVKIQHGPAMDNKGRFMVALRDDAEWKDFNFLSVDLNVEGQPPAGKVNTKLCRDTRQPQVVAR